MGIKGGRVGDKVESELSDDKCSGVLGDITSGDLKVVFARSWMNRDGLGAGTVLYAAEKSKEVEKNGSSRKKYRDWDDSIGSTRRFVKTWDDDIKVKNDDEDSSETIWRSKLKCDDYGCTEKIQTFLSEDFRTLLVFGCPQHGESVRACILKTSLKRRIVFEEKGNDDNDNFNEERKSFLRQTTT